MSKDNTKFTSNQYILAILIIVVLGIFARSYYDAQHAKKILNKDIEEFSSTVHSVIEDNIIYLNTKYIAISSHYQNNEIIHDFIKTRNRKELYKTVKYEYDSLKSLQPNLYVMHFHDTENTTILRMHRPEVYNDNLTDIRFMIKDANRDKVVKTGVEIGKNGITYRIAIPLLTHESEHLGVLEYGINIDYFYNELQHGMNIEAQTLVKTENLKYLIDKKKFEQLGEYSIVGTAPIFEKINTKLDLKKDYQLINIEDKTYIVFNDMNLNYDENKEVLKIIILKDITYLVDKYNQSLYLIYTVYFFILLFIYLLFNRYRKETELLQNHLENKVSEQVEEIEKSAVILDTIFETTKNGIAILDLNSNFKLVNNAYTTLTGYTKEELYQRTYFSLNTPKKPDKSNKILEDVLEKGFYGSYEISCIKKDGKIIDVIMDFTLMPDKKSLLLVTKNVTLKNKYERESRKREELLLKQSRMAQMGEMISMIAHQWRQPLGAISSTAIDLYMQIEFEKFDLEKEKGRKECQAYFINGLKEIDGFVQNLTSTIDDFRNFYKPNKESDLVFLNDPISKAFSIIRTSLVSDGIEIVEQYMSHNKIELYLNEIMQVILNILKNSQDNFKEKSIKNPKITITSKDDNDKTILKICDNGGGIPEDILSKIFDPYFSTKDELNGTGLGLHMSKTIVEEHHNGSLEVLNLDDGVCFKIIMNRELKQ